MRLVKIVGTVDMARADGSTKHYPKGTWWLVFKNEKLIDVWDDETGKLFIQMSSE